MAEAMPQDSVSKTAVKLRELKAKIESLKTKQEKEAELGLCKLDKEGDKANFKEATNNALKNRHTDTNPYDTNAVKLKTKADGSYYVNASPMAVRTDYGETKFIAAMGPKKDTVPQFLQMLLDCGVTVVVMLTKCEEDNKPKCHQYWPDPQRSSTGQFNGFEVKLKSQDTETEGGWVERELKLKGKVIRQLQYTDWPMSEAPDYEKFDKFFTRARQVISEAADSNVVVHCSGGVGRTGTFIALHRLCYYAGWHDSVDVIKVVRQLREDRPKMVQKPGQLKFIYEFLYNKFVRLPAQPAATPSSSGAARPDPDWAPVPLGELEAKLESLTEEELGRVHKLFKTYDVGPNTSNASQALANKRLNRNKDVLPYDSNIVTLTHSIDNTQYVNASRLAVQEGYGATRFIAAMGPMEKTAPQFLQLLLDCEVKVVVMLTPFTEWSKKEKKEVEKCHQYWRSDLNKRKEFSQIRVNLRSEDKVDGGFVERVLHLQRGNQQQTVRQLHLTTWPDHDALDVGQFDKFFTRARQVISEAAGSNVVVHCSAGTGRTGTFIALHRLCYYAARHETVDVMGVVLQLRKERPLMVQSKEQLKQIYEYLSYKFSAVLLRPASGRRDRPKAVSHLSSESG